MSPSANSSDLSLIAIHARVWERKSHLREAYARYHDLLIGQCPEEGRVLELGCGLGKLATRARAAGRTRWISTDIIAAPGARLRCDATALPARTASLDRIVFVDVLHHLGAPQQFFREAARTLRQGGIVACVEPWVTPFSYPIYRYLHQEGCDLSRDAVAPFAAAGSKPAYQGDNAIPTVVCRGLGEDRWRELGFAAPAISIFNDFAYLTTRGFREGMDAPGPLFNAARVLDRFLSAASRVFGMRALIRWERLPR